MHDGLAGHTLDPLHRHHHVILFDDVQYSQSGYAMPTLPSCGHNIVEQKHTMQLDN